MFVLVNMASNPILFNKYLFITTIHGWTIQVSMKAFITSYQSHLLMSRTPQLQSSIQVSLMPVSPAPHTGHSHRTWHSIRVWGLYVKMWVYL